LYKETSDNSNAQIEERKRSRAFSVKVQRFLIVPLLKKQKKKQTKPFFPPTAPHL